jgi:hypothetical protein
MSAVVPGEHSETRDPYSAAELRSCGVWVSAFAGTTSGDSLHAMTDTNEIK